MCVEYIQTNITSLEKNPKPPFNSLKISFLHDVFKKCNYIWKPWRISELGNNAEVQRVFARFLITRRMQLKFRRNRNTACRRPTRGRLSPVRNWSVGFPLGTSKRLSRVDFAPSLKSHFSGESSGGENAKWIRAGKIALKVFFSRVGGKRKSRLRGEERKISSSWIPSGGRGPLYVVLGDFGRVRFSLLNKKKNTKKPPAARNG